jgi:hypothetical protein
MSALNRLSVKSFYVAAVCIALSTNVKAAEHYCGGTVVNVALYGDKVHVSLSSTTSDTYGNWPHNAGTTLSWVAVCRLDGSAVEQGNTVIHSASSCKAAYQSLLAAKLTGAKVRFAFSSATTPPAPCIAPTKPNWSSLPSWGMYFGPEIYD